MEVECRGNRRGERHTDDCVPFDYDSQGWPLGMHCSGDGCGAWICNKADHSIHIRSGKKVYFYCRTCIKDKNIPKKFMEKVQPS